jgi:hypothetical protein
MKQAQSTKERTREEQYEEEEKIEVLKHNLEEIDDLLGAIDALLEDTQTLPNTINTVGIEQALGWIQNTGAICYNSTAAFLKAKAELAKQS